MAFIIQEAVRREWLVGLDHGGRMNFRTIPS